MKTIQNPVYTIGCSGKTTTCTLYVSVAYITTLLAKSVHIKTDIIESDIVTPSNEAKFFYRELKYCGYSINYPKIHVKTSVTLHEGDVYNPVLAVKLVKRKALRLACYKVATAINRVVEHRKRETEKLENIAIKLQIMSKHYEK